MHGDAVDVRELERGRARAVAGLEGRAGVGGADRGRGRNSSRSWSGARPCRPRRRWGRWRSTATAPMLEVPTRVEDRRPARCRRRRSSTRRREAAPRYRMSSFVGCTARAATRPLTRPIVQFSIVMLRGPTDCPVLAARSSSAPLACRRSSSRTASARSRSGRVTRVQAARVHEPLLAPADLLLLALGLVARWPGRTGRAWASASGGATAATIASSTDAWENLGEYIEPLGSAGVAAGIDSIFLEVHDHPSRPGAMPKTRCRWTGSSPC